MRSDKFEHKIIEAAENHHPTYDEKAWQNMEKLLDKHLPQEKEKKRRFIFFIFFLLLLGGVGIWYLPGLNNSDQQLLSQSKSDVTLEHEKKADVQSIQPVGDMTIGNATLKRNNSVTVTNINTSNIQVKVVEQNLIKRSKEEFEDKAIKNGQKNDGVYGNGSETKSLVPKKNIDDGNPSTVVTNANNMSETVMSNNNNEINLNTNITTAEPVSETGTAVVEEKETPAKKEKTKNRKSDFFFVSLSAGPDISFVRPGKTGSTKILAGAGIGYTLKNRLSIRTGFYAGRKVYTASPEAYSPPPGFSQYYPILENVEADCKVYEIPVSLSYHFTRSEKQNWFAGAGISSLFMKKEKYNYTYKYTATGPSYKSDWTINNENKHYFSVLTLSAGYQRQLNKAVSITAEPYIKIPLQGIGYGNVKLNSTGVLFTLSVKPFAAKPEK